MHEQTFTVDFGVAGKVHFVVESSEALSQCHTLGCIEVACGELISQNQTLMNSQADD